MSNLIIPATDERVIKDVEHIRSTLKDKYGFKADIDDLPPIMQNPAPGITKYLVLIASKITPQEIFYAEKICRCLNIDDALDFSKYQFMLPPRNEIGYFVWMNSAKGFFGQNERAGTLYEGLHFFSQYNAKEDGLTIKENKSVIYFMGSRGVNGGVPCLSRWHGVLHLSVSRPGYANSRYGSVSAGVFLNS